MIERPGATVDETAEAFDIDRSTLLSDLDTIGYCGLPGLGGGDLFEVSVVEDRIVVDMADELRRPLRLNPREALRLVLAGEAVASALGEQVPALRSALDRVRATVGIPVGVRVELDEDGTQWLPELRTAIAAQRRVRIAYRGRGDDAPVERVLDPWTLQVAEGTWYVQGHDERADDVRVFRLDRIHALDVVGEPWAHAPPDDIVVRVPRYEPGPDDVEVELFLPAGARWVAEAVVADEVEDLEHGARRIVFATDALPWVVSLIVSTGQPVRVLRPPALAEQVRYEAELALSRYA